VSVSPSWGFVFLTDNRSLAGHALSQANLAEFPTNLSGDGATLLPPPPPSDPYELIAWAAGYLNSSATPRGVSANATVSFTLSPALSSPMEAPIYLTGDAQATALGGLGIAGVTYNAGTQTLSIAPGSDPLAPPFLRLNDYDFPTFVLFAAYDRRHHIDTIPSNGCALRHAPNALFRILELGEHDVRMNALFRDVLRIDGTEAFVNPL
jgi:hypothetical protein